ncbi:MAG: endonuclease domain-containing protein [Solirubrobacterales bacterium]
MTLLDLAGLLGGGELATALNEARVLRLVRESELEATLGRHPQRRGAAALRKLLASERGPRMTRSEAERRALALMRRHGLEPETDVEIGPWRVDFLFRDERVVVEVDGYRYHSTPKRFVEDRRRAADLTARGFALLSLTWDDLGPEAGAAMTKLLKVLEGRRAV